MASDNNISIFLNEKGDRISNRQFRDRVFQGVLYHLSFIFLQEKKTAKWKIGLSFSAEEKI